VPSASDIANVQRLYPDASIFVLVEKGTKLSDCIRKQVPNSLFTEELTLLTVRQFFSGEDIQDPGSFRYCLVHLGANSFGELYPLQLHTTPRNFIVVCVTSVTTKDTKLMRHVRAYFHFNLYNMYCRN
jgi:hypothetical protein